MAAGRMFAAGLAALSLFAAGGAACAETVVATASGRVAGVAEGGVVAFKGLPFAQPPVRALRWRAPQAAAPWRDVRAGDRFGPACPQHNPEGYGPDPKQAEDCLYLNVWTPRPAGPAARLPVMVWIYGGSFVRGDGAHPMFNGAALARDGVIVVTFNYRLGRLGWFAHPALTREAAGAGTADYGLMDQIAALKWVRDNIAAFGGDPANVTIFGESAGAMSVNLLMVSPDARGLFAKAITESGLGRIPATPLAAAETQGEAFAKTAGAGDLDALRRLPVEAVLAGQAAATTGGAVTPGPIIDGKLVPSDVDRAFAEGRQAHVPWIIGSNDYEADLLPAYLDDPDGKVFSTVPAAARTMVMALFDPKKTGDKRTIAAELLADTVFTEPARFLAAAHRRQGQPVYRYFFTYVPLDDRGKIPGAGHSAEIQFVFDNLGTYRWSTSVYSDPDRKIAADMARYWTNFAKTGDPNGPRLAAWPVDKDDQVLVVDSEGEHAAAALRKPRLDLLAAQAGVH